jgi:hypothetical protein
MVTNNAYLGFPGLGLKESGSFGRTHPHVVSGVKVKEGSKNVVLQIELTVLGVVGLSGASSYGVPLASAWIL